MDDDKAPPPRVLARRELLQIGAAGLAALGASGATAAGEGIQTPGSGQGARPPQPPAAEYHRESRDDARRRLVGAMGLAAGGMAGTTADAADRGQPPFAARDRARQPLLPPLQFQRRKPGADDSHAWRCGAAREAAKHARPESRTGAERSGAGSVRDSARRSRGRALRHVEGPGSGMFHAAGAGPRTPRRDL